MAITRTGVDGWYAGRSTHYQPVSLSLEVEAVKLLRQYAPGEKGYGRFVSRLVYEHAARQREREKLQRELAAVFDEPGDGSAAGNHR